MPTFPNLRWRYVDSTAPLRGVSGVYLAQLMDPGHPGRPLALQRFIKKDLRGIVDIGQSSNLGNRFVSFHGALFGTCHHSAGWTLGYTYDRSPWLQGIYRTKEALRDNVRFSYALMDRSRLRPTESWLIDDYCSVFAEPPMLVSTVPGVARSIQRRRYRQMLPDPGTLPEGLQWVPDDILTRHPPDPLTNISCVYRVHAMDPDDRTKFLPVKRAGGTDPLGILEEGQTLDMARRKRQIRFDLLRGKTSSEWTMEHHVWELCDRLQAIYGSLKEFVTCLGFTIIETPADLLRLRESQLLDGSIRIYAELPPTNSQVPGKWR
jgi:hypothetical protein